MTLAEWLAMIREPWMRDALCAEPGYGLELFYSDRGASNDDAKRVCARCLVRRECLAYALRDP